MRAPAGPGIAAGEVLLAVEDVSLAFGGVKAVSGVCSAGFNTTAQPANFHQ
jgi:hypothetical protein